MSGTSVPPSNMELSPNLYKENNESVANGFEYSTASIRRGFIRKVYSLLSLQLLFMFGATVAFTFMNDETKLLAEKNWWILVVAAVLFLVSTITLACCDGVRRKFPINLIFLGIFTIGASLITGYCTLKIDPQIVMLALGVTVVIVIALTVFAFQTKWDFTMLGGILFAATGLLIMFSIILAITRSYYLEMIYSALGAAVFSVYLIYDTQMIIGGGHRLQLSPEEYILGTITLFLDILNIYLYILRILAALKK